MEMSNKITTFFTFFLFNLWLFSSCQSLAKERNPNNVILGLIRSRASLPIPNASSNSRKSARRVLDMTEPLREIRDGYLLPLYIGTPPQVIQVYMDTGSDLNWVPCWNSPFRCIDCAENKNNKLVGTFSPFHSFSSYNESCASPYCTDVHSSDNSFDPCTVAGCSLAILLTAKCYSPCPSFAYTYGAGGVVTGTLTKDVLTVHERGSGGGGGINRAFPNFCFGCVGSAFREPIGIAGFGRGILSFPSQLGFLDKGFSHCFLAFKYANKPNFSSPLVMGDMDLSSKDKMQFTPMLKNLMYPNYYYIGLEAVTLGNLSVKVPLNLSKFDSYGNGGMIIDSGTTYTHLSEPFYSQLLRVFESVINYPRAPEVETRSGFDLCYKVSCPNNTCMPDDDHQFPSVTFHFLNNVSLPLPSGNHFYSMKAPTSSTVVKCLLFQCMDDGGQGPTGVFGNFQQHNVEIVYDLEKERIGFEPKDCASVATSQPLHNY